VDILRNGSLGMVKSLIEAIHVNKGELVKNEAVLIVLFESNVASLNDLAKETYELLSINKKKEILLKIIDSPHERAYLFGIEQLNQEFGNKIPREFMVPLLEHESTVVKGYVSELISHVITNLGKSKENGDLFLYYARTILLLPNQVSKSKDRIYQALPLFAEHNREKLPEIKELLLELGGSNIIIDSERALVALAKIKMEVEHVFN
jgi:hypothetical protein